jgi:hypothetical protein
MLQWITALEKVAASSPYAGSNRFDSFSPIRMNVAAQWLVDGVNLHITYEIMTRLTSRSVITSGICPVRFS